VPLASRVQVARHDGFMARCVGFFIAQFAVPLGAAADRKSGAGRSAQSAAATNRT